jgi:hypothetical protein
VRKPLADRLDDAATVLDGVDALVSRHAGTIAPELEAALGDLATAKSDIPAWKSVLASRTAARRYLDDLLTEVDGQDQVRLGQQRIKFAYGRLIGVDAYLAVTWSLADRIAAMVGRIVCVGTRGGLLAGGKDAELVGHFVRTENGKTSGPSLLWEAMQREFAWPVCVSYALRNHFFHDAAQVGGASFFDGEVAQAGFAISQHGCERIKQKVENTYRVSDSMCSSRCQVTLTPGDDLRNLLDACEPELDAALGFLLASATAALQRATEVLLGPL